jgi:hypothetical protein
MQVKYRITVVVPDKYKGGKRGFVLDDVWFRTPLFGLLLLEYLCHKKETETDHKVVKIMKYSVV